ncbi:spore germination protein [Metallumcola ferriviriculae]|uniref:Spore germination protein n=2 Tax=Metallumcola ferriviriculae TaxID=3039180 RepID=A0AAU0UQT0_9FIRM|nr:spore germination protein [Desulfitibacteraceae bacterium MK1]
MRRFIRPMDMNQWKEKRQEKAVKPVEIAVDLGQFFLEQDIKKNQQNFETIFRKCSDIVNRPFTVGGKDGLDAMLVYTDGLIDKDTINNFLMRSVMLMMGDKADELTKKNAFQLLKDSVISIGEVSVVKTIEEAVDKVLVGECIFMVDGHTEGLSLSVRGWQSRGITEPTTETVVRGPREGLTETLRFNTAMLRRKIKSPDLKIEVKVKGKFTKTDVAVCYISGLANQGVIHEVFQRLERIDIDGILESSYIEELIEDEPWSPFPQMEYTERPDVVAANLLEGRVAIMVDGTPFVLMVPTVFSQFIQSPEDYYQRFFLSSFFRIGRFLALNIALLLPSVYVASTTFHQEMIPTPLLISIASQREGVPFPALVEALIMELTFELLREAGVRLPRAVGQAVSIVGALVIGDAAVTAGIVSPAMVIVVAVTALASFSLPAFNMAITLRMLRFPIIILAGTLGFYGIMVALLAILIHLTGLRSFGVPYLAPVAPFRFSEWRDVLVRAPWWAMDYRPRSIEARDLKRQAEGLMPEPSQNKDEEEQADD